MVGFKDLKSIGLNTFGVDGRTLIALRFFPRFARDLLLWKRKGGAINSLLPILKDYADSAGSARGHYFHQDLFVAQKISEERPENHLDVGSRLDGFVAHVASFMEVTVADVRPASLQEYTRIKFIIGDISSGTFDRQFQSVSSLHVIEHVGLGRYGDPIRPDGHVLAVDNLAKSVAVGGRLYLSFPISDRPRVEYNAHRVLHPTFVFGVDAIKAGFVLENFALVDDSGSMLLDKMPDQVHNMHYGCGIYIFRRAS